VKGKYASWTYVQRYIQTVTNTIPTIPEEHICYKNTGFLVVNSYIYHISAIR